MRNHFIYYTLWRIPKYKKCFEPRLIPTTPGNAKGGWTPFRAHPLIRLSAPHSNKLQTDDLLSVHTAAYRQTWPSKPSRFLSVWLHLLTLLVGRFLFFVLPFLQRDKTPILTQTRPKIVLKLLSVWSEASFTSKNYRRGMTAHTFYPAQCMLQSIQLVVK